jgi:hypothetical protein
MSNSTYGGTYCTVHICTEDQIKYTCQIFNFLSFLTGLEQCSNPQLDSNSQQWDSNRTCEYTGTHRLIMKLDLQSLFGPLCTAVLMVAETPQLPTSPRIWAHLRGRYWSAKRDDIVRFVTILFLVALLRSGRETEGEGGSSRGAAS